MGGWRMEGGSGEGERGGGEGASHVNGEYV